MVEISGGGLILGTGSDGSTIRGLDIIDVTGGTGLDIESGKNTVQSNDFGVLPDGVTAAANDQGILINGSNNTIGGTTAAAGNVIAFNSVGINVNTGSGDTIRGNPIYSNTTSAIVLQTNANNNQQPPALTLATSNAGTTTVEGTVSAGTPSGTILDFYADAPGQTPARTYLGSYVVTTGTSFSATLTAAVSTGLNITATSTSPTGDTSQFAGTVDVASPLAVTNTNSSGVGSLSSAIAAADANPPESGATDQILFNIPTSDSGYNPATSTFTIDLNTALQDITVPITIDGTTESTYLSSLAGNPVTAFIQISGGGSIADGLVLSTATSPSSTSAGSTIDGLEITGFTGDAIQIKTSNNTIGGTATNSGNTITGNSGKAIDVLSGSGNAIRQNLIYNNPGGAIVLASPIPAAPSIVAVASVPNLTTIDYTITGTAAGTYTVEFFASSGSENPAAQFLGTATVTLAAAGSSSQTAMLTASTTTFDDSTGLLNGQTVTATLTGPDNSTSEFATAVTPRTPTSSTSAFAVTNTSDNVQGSFVGSLRLAILDANNSPPGSGTDDITFAIAGGGAFTISPTAVLPTIVVPVTIDGTTEAGGQINGGLQSFNGLTLGTDSDGSTIEGLTIVDFGGNGIAVQSSNNTIGGTATGAGNTIGSNATNGIAILSGTGNVVLENLYVGTNGSVVLPSVAANDIALTPGANGNLQAPQLLSASLASTGSTLSIALASLVSVATSLDVYLLGSNQRTFLGETSISAGDDSGTLSVSGLTIGAQILATQTNATDGTSAFSAPLAIIPAATVTNTNDDGPGSLRAAIDAAESGGSTDITFQIPGTGPFVIGLKSTLSITVPLTIDGTSELTIDGTPAIVLQNGNSKNSNSVFNRSGPGDWLDRQHD